LNNGARLLQAEMIIIDRIDLSRSTTVTCDDLLVLSLTI
jgi:hypothetical protein